MDQHYQDQTKFNLLKFLGILTGWRIRSWSWWITLLLEKHHKVFFGVHSNNLLPIMMPSEMAPGHVLRRELTARSVIYIFVVLFYLMTPLEHIAFRIILDIKHMVILKYFFTGSPLSPYSLLFPINGSSKGSCVCTFPQTGQDIPQPLIDQRWTTGWKWIAAKLHIIAVTGIPTPVPTA